MNMKRMALVNKILSFFQNCDVFFFFKKYQILHKSMLLQNFGKKFLFFNIIKKNEFFFLFVRLWDGTVRFMPRLKLCLIKQNHLTLNKTDNDDQIVSIDHENESMDSDVE